MNSKKWLEEWFNVNVGINFEEDQKLLAKNYFEAGWIDSFSFIEFISEIEEEFKIEFSNSEFQNREFSTINGLSGVINKKIQEK